MVCDEQIDTKHGKKTKKRLFIRLLLEFYRYQAIRSEMKGEDFEFHI